MPDADGDIDAPARELGLDDAEMGGPDTVILAPARRHQGFAPLELSVDAGASAAQRRVLRVGNDQASAIRSDSDGDGGEPQKAGHHSNVSFERHRDLLHWYGSVLLVTERRIRRIARVVESLSR